jgi:hypothetical protein
MEKFGIAQRLPLNAWTFEFDSIKIFLIFFTAALLSAQTANGDFSSLTRPCCICLYGLPLYFFPQILIAIVMDV